MISIIADSKSEIDVRIEEFLEEEITFLKTINEWGEDALKRLRDMSVQGKTIRGALSVFSYEMFGGRKRYAAIDMAVALELLQSAVLIHDDIIDRDDLRRGNPTIAKQYSDLATQRGYIEPKHYGLSLGICAADLGFFLAFKRLSALDAATETIQKIISLTAREMTIVGLGEMDDVTIASSPVTATEDAVNSMYRYKTARYTFSLPLMAGAILARQTEKVIGQLESLGELCGLIFQLRDDELALFGSEAETGKAVGNDIKENKKTILAIKLFRKITPQEKEKTNTIFGNASATPDEIAYVCTLMEKYGIRAEINLEIERLEKTALASVEQLPTTAQYKKNLTEMISFLQHRTK